MSMHEGPATALPEVITRYLTAHCARDTESAISAFAGDAVVVDDGRTYAGADGVRTFVTKAAAEFKYTTTLIAAEEIAPDKYLAVNHLAGNFPGSPVDLRYQFALHDGLIASLTIEP
jgi:ketosteroid isomerase-like protein